MAHKAILLNVEDDVATALTDLTKGEKVSVSLDHITVETILSDDVQFGHKYALREIARGEDILKYGLPIGRALVDIHAGQWVHVHNCRSERFGFYRQQYGLNA